MAEPNQKDLAQRQTQALYTRTKLTPQEVADRAKMSVNTVKKVLFGAKKDQIAAHLNSVLKVQRALEQYIASPEDRDREEHALILSGDASKDVVTLAKKLAMLMQDLVFEPEKAEAKDIEALQRLLTLCHGQMTALAN